MQEQNQYWYFLIGGQSDDITGIVGNFYAYGSHCGEALANALQAAAENNFLNPQATEAARLDNLEDFEEPDDLIQLSGSVLTGSKNYSYPIDSEEHVFIPPTGIIKSTEDGEFDYDLIRSGFVAHHDAEAGSFELELVADKAELLNTLLSAIRCIPNPQKVEIGIKGFWNNQQSESWVNDSIHSQDGIIGFLQENQANILDNGFIECAIYFEQGETKLTFDEHKKILLFTKDEPVFNKFGKKMMDLGFSQTTKLHNFEYGFYHWHYRPADSLASSELRLLLLDADYRFVKKWDEDYTASFVD